MARNDFTQFPLQARDRQHQQAGFSEVMIALKLRLTPLIAARALTRHTCGNSAASRNTETSR